MFHNTSMNRARSFSLLPWLQRGKNKGGQGQGHVKTGLVAEPRSFFPALTRPGWERRRDDPGGAAGYDDVRSQTNKIKTPSQNEMRFFFCPVFLKAKTESLSLHKELILAITSYVNKTSWQHWHKGVHKV